MSSTECRVIIDPPFDGARNMAIDEVLLEAGLSGVATLRFYQWAAPTVSLGHFQAVSSEAVPHRFQGLPVVRRLSGGGALLHDQELTYSCVLPKEHPVSRDPSQLYDLIHAALVAELEEHGVPCRMRGDDAFEDKSFLCFSRGDARDIVIGSQKIVGSAQRRRQGAVLQHGALLLSTSKWAPEFPGVQQLAGKVLPVDLLISRLQRKLTDPLNLTPIPGTLTESELAAVEAAIERYRISAD